MRRLLPVLLVLGSCNPPPASDVAHTGPPVTDAPEVLGMSLVRPDLTPTPVATTAPPVVPATVAPPVVVTTTTTAPVVPLTAAPAVRSGDCGGWRDLIAVSFPGEVDYACQVFIGCESKGDPNAVSDTNDHGLTQVNEPTWNKPGHHDPVADWIGRHWHSVYDPATNLEMARRIRAAYGWRMWACA